MKKTMSEPGFLRAHNHAELRQLWSRMEPRRAAGGWWSLSGFSIQTTVAFERFFRRSLIEGKADAFSMEGISDLSEAGAKIHLTQVKRTLTRATLASAVAEACKIVNLCSPALVEKLEFQVICERNEVGLKPSDLNADDVFGDDPHAIDNLDVVLARFNPQQPVKVVGNPGLALRRTLLEAGVDDPDKVARTVLGTLFDAFDGRNKEGVETALYKALSEVKALVQPKGVAAGRLLTPNLFVRRSNSKSALFVGARPRLDELVDNRFLSRANMLEPLIVSADAWVADLENSFRADALRLPILWLEGRSGDGKSILALQLLESLVALRGRLASVTELKSESELSAWLASASPWESETPDQAEIGFVDDLGALLNASDVDRLIDNAFYRGSRYVGLITCGTPEVGNELAAKRHVALTRVAIDAPTNADFEAFRQWAERRLGRSFQMPESVGATLSEYISGLTLLDANGLRPSAKLPENLRLVLAVNALGLSAPRSLVNDAELLAFTRNHPDIDLAPIEEDGGVRLAHAEASLSLYVDGLAGATLAETWGNDLGRALALRLNAGDHLSARTILGELMNSRRLDARRKRSGDSAAETVLFDAVYRAFQQACPIESRAPLFRQWLVATYRKRLTVVTLAELRDSGRMYLADQLSLSEIKSEVASALLTVGERTEDAASRDAANYLRHAGPDVAAVKFAIGALSKREPNNTADTALAWLSRNATKREVGEVLAQVVGRSSSDKVRAVATDFVKRFIEDPVSGPVIGRLASFDGSEAFLKLQDQWLRHCPDTVRAVAIYGGLLRGPRWRQYTERALTLMQRCSDVRGGQEVLSSLLRKRRGDTRILEVARRWLDQHEGEAQATPVLLELVEVQPINAGDLARALRHVGQGAPGANSLFATIAVVLQGFDADSLKTLRRALPGYALHEFDAAMHWTPKLEGRLQKLRNRLSRTVK